MTFIRKQAIMTSSNPVAVLLTKALVTLVAVVALWLLFGATTAHGASVVLSINGQGSANVAAGSNVNLSWEAIGVSNCTINNGVGAVPNLGSRTVTAPTTGSVIYTIACTGGQTSSVTVSVKPYIDMYATPSVASPNVAGGKADVKLNWSVTNASKCTKLTAKDTKTGITRTIFTNANQPVKSSINDLISANTTYTLTCINTQNGQTDTESENVTFVAFGPPKINSFTINKGSSAPWDPNWGGVNLKLTFLSTNTEKCIRSARDKNGNPVSISGWTATNVNLSSTDWIAGGFTATIPDTTTFELRCGRPGTNEWTSTQSLLFTVTAVPSGGGGGATTTSPTVDLIAPPSVSVPSASNLPVKVTVETKSSFTNHCTYQAFNAGGTAITVNGWTNRISAVGINATFDVFISQTTRLKLNCTRTSTNTTVSDEETIVVAVNAGGPADLELSATAIGVQSNVQRIRLDWVGTNVNLCQNPNVLQNNVVTDTWYKNGTIPLSGVTTAGVYADSVYSLTCINSVTGERITDTVTVLLNEFGEAEVVEASAGLNTGPGGTAPSVALNGNPNPSPSAGTTVVLTWVGKNVTTCDVKRGATVIASNRPASSNMSVTPAVDTTYTVECTGPNGDADDSELVTIGLSNTPDVELTATTPSTGPGTPVTLTWDGTNVTNCTLRNIVTNAVVGSSVGPDGSANLNPGPLVNTDYRVTCSSGSGSVTDDETVVVASLEDLGDTMELQASPIVVHKGGTTRITWFADPLLTSTGPGCKIHSNGIPLPNVLTGSTGSITSPVLNAETTFSLVCSGVTNPPAEASVRVRVIPVMGET